MTEIIKFQKTELTPAQVKWDKEGIEEKLNIILETYTDLIFTKDTISDGKKTCAELNKLKTKLDDERKRVKKLLMEDVTIFEAEIKDLIKQINSVYDPIKSQLVNFENDREEKKKMQIGKLINKLLYKANLNIPKDDLFEKRYLNKGITIKAITEEVEEKIDVLVKEQESYNQNKNLTR